MASRLLTLSVYFDGKTRFPFTVKIHEAHGYTSEVALSHDEAYELWILLSQQFQKPKRAKRKGAKK